MIAKVLVANRGEIAIRAFRAAYELGVGTVAIYAYEDRNSLHRTKADESYQIGEVGHPVRAYLRRRDRRDRAPGGADAIYPGYGFLSENPDLAAACVEAGITFVGPSAEVLELTGNKSRAIAAAPRSGTAGADVVGTVVLGRRTGFGGTGHAVSGIRQSGSPAAGTAACAASPIQGRCAKPSKPPVGKRSRRSATRPSISSKP